MTGYMNIATLYHHAILSRQIVIDFFFLIFDLITGIFSILLNQDEAIMKLVTGCMIITRESCLWCSLKEKGIHLSAQQ